ncbi:MAG: TatD family hydrolase [bacterium]|nr:TatD family hydrolase [bacterium]
MKFFDAHAHIQLPQFDTDRAEVLARMQADEVGAIVVGTDFETSKVAVELAEQHDFLWASVGLHPNHPSTDSTSSPQASSGQVTLEEFEVLAKHPKVVAIGECGLDYYRQEPTEVIKKIQHERFKKHITLALATSKPLIVHCRPTRGTQNAHEEMFELLTANSGVRVVMHFFTSTKEIAEKYLALGCYLSFPGPVTFGDMYDEAIRATPLDRMLSETDSPFAAPVPCRGTRNEPIYVVEVVKKIATVKSLPVDEVATHICNNACTVFGLW